MRQVSNPPNPWQSTGSEYLDGMPEVKLEVFEEQARSIVAENNSPDVGFRFGINPYRGCYHACAYCYARPSHQYLDFGAGTDFDTKIIVKTNAAELLRKHFDKKSWQGDVIAISGNTDCYQPLEASYQLTRQLLEVCAEYRNPVGLITKSGLVRRDIDVLQELNRATHVVVNVSLAYTDDDMRRKIEPYTSSVKRRLETIMLLSRAGITTGVLVAPIIPGLNDSQLVGVLKAARDSGAISANRILMRLPREVLPVFQERLQAAYPDRAQKVMNAVLDVRGGKYNESRFGQRMSGVGPRWQAVENMFDIHRDRLGFQPFAELTENTFRRPQSQLNLFAAV